MNDHEKDLGRSGLIDALGGPVRLAALCEVSHGAVPQWRKSGIPRAWTKYFEARFPEIVARFGAGGFV